MATGMPDDVAAAPSRRRIRSCVWITAAVPVLRQPAGRVFIISKSMLRPRCRRSAGDIVRIQDHEPENHRMSISYFDCKICKLEMNDCYGDFVWWQCSNCDDTYCDDCVTGTWSSCVCSGFDYCESCTKAGKACSCGAFCCYGCKDGSSMHTPGCPVRPARAAVVVVEPPRTRKRRKRKS